MENIKVGIIGLGNMGSAMADLIASNGYQVIGWEYDGNVVDEINDKRLNTKFLPRVKLHSNLKATKRLSDVFSNCKIIFIVIPSLFIKNTLQQFQKKINKDIILVNLAKGIDNNTGMTSLETISFLFPDNDNIMFSGPSIANEFSRKTSTVVVIAGKNRKSLSIVSHILDNNYFRTYISNDEIGVELGGILKNIYAIGLGLFIGGKIGVNFKAAYLVIALNEMKKIGKIFGAKEETFLCFSGIGDLIATSLSKHSHNKRMGELLSQGLNIREIKNEMGNLPEGYYSLKMILNTLNKLNVSVPLIQKLNDIINGSYKVKKFTSSFIENFVKK